MRRNPGHAINLDNAGYEWTEIKLGVDVGCWWVGGRLLLLVAGYQIYP